MAGASLYFFSKVKACTLRGQMEFTFAEKPLDLSEVEPASSIVKRFCTGKYQLYLYWIVLLVLNLSSYRSKVDHLLLLHLFETVVL